MVQQQPGAVPPAVLAGWLAALDAQPGASLKLADALDLRQVLAVLRPVIEVRWPGLMSVLSVVASQCWVRRARPPHQWHQDGALHHDFIAQPAGELLPMETCWIPLNDCGVDAPGLEWLDAEPGRMLAPAELSDAALRARYAADAFRHPPLTAGDALFFDGGQLHRTHVTPAMNQPRTSIELRFIAAGPVPPRLTRETLLSWREFLS